MNSPGNSRPTSSSAGEAGCSRGSGVRELTSGVDREVPLYSQPGKHDDLSEFPKNFVHYCNLFGWKRERERESRDYDDTKDTKPKGLTRRFNLRIWFAALQSRVWIY